jgi:glyoxalase family protein
MEPESIRAIHHITAIAASAAENLAFYEDLLGLRLVKQTVNFDDPYTYHLYFGDGSGAPGTILTFFPWEGAAPGRPGSGMIGAIALAVPRSALPYWEERLTAHGVRVQPDEVFGEPRLKFQDPHGLTLNLTGAAAAPTVVPWAESPVPPGKGIRGLHAATMRLADAEATDRLLCRALGMERVQATGPRIRYRMRANRSAGHFLDVQHDPQMLPGRQGAGSVHHIAFRARSDAEQAAWRRRLVAEGFAVTAIIDRKYFKSIYFREPGGVLFEIATDPPGFAVDEAPDALGASLQLPPQYEPERARIVAALPLLRIPASQEA